MYKVHIVSTVCNCLVDVLDFMGAHKGMVQEVGRVGLDVRMGQVDHRGKKEQATVDNTRHHVGSPYVSEGSGGDKIECDGVFYECCHQKTLTRFQFGEEAVRSWNVGSLPDSRLLDSMWS
jgi:hypothetical protein